MERQEGEPRSVQQARDVETVQLVLENTEGRCRDRVHYDGQRYFLCRSVEKEGK